MTKKHACLRLSFETSDRLTSKEYFGYQKAFVSSPDLGGTDSLDYVYDITVSHKPGKTVREADLYTLYYASHVVPISLRGAAVCGQMQNVMR